MTRRFGSIPGDAVLAVSPLFDDTPVTAGMDVLGFAAQVAGLIAETAGPQE